MLILYHCKFKRKYHNVNEYTNVFICMILYLSERINYVLSITYNDILKCPVKPGLRAQWNVIL